MIEAKVSSKLKISTAKTIGAIGALKIEAATHVLVLPHYGLRNQLQRGGVTVTDGKITGNNVNIDWDGNHNMVWVAGSSTDGIIDDDIFEISGTATGRNSRGNTFVNEITDPYTSDLSCQPNIGVFEFTTLGFSVMLHNALLICIEVSAFLLLDA